MNFAGVAFVATLDDTTFLLSQTVFFGRGAKQLAHRVTGFQSYSGENGRGIGKKIKIVLFIVITAAMWAGLSVFVYNQNNLVYACRSVTVLVEGESKYPWVRIYGGWYDRNATNKVFQRAEYVKPNKGGLTGDTKDVIFYDVYANRWVVGEHYDDINNKLNGWTLVSLIATDLGRDYALDCPGYVNCFS